MKNERLVVWFRARSGWLLGISIAFVFGMIFGYFVQKNKSIKQDATDSYSKSSENASAFPSYFPDSIGEISISYQPLDRNSIKNCAAKAEYEELDAACSPNSPTLRYQAQQWARLRGALDGSSVLRLADSLLFHWKYRADPTGSDVLLPAAEVLRTGLQGDCEDQAALGAALFQALGARVRYVKAWNKNEGHAWIEVNVGDSKYWEHASILSIVELKGHRIHQENGWYWLRVDATCAAGSCFEAEKRFIFDLAEKSCWTDPKKLVD